MLASMLLPAAFQPWFRGVGFNALDTYAALTQLLSLAWVVGAALRVPGLLALRNAYFERLPAHELRREVELHWMTIKTSLLSMVMILFLLGLQLLTCQATLYSLP